MAIRLRIRLREDYPSTRKAAAKLKDWLLKNDFEMDGERLISREKLGKGEIDRVNEFQATCYNEVLDDYLRESRVE